MMVGNAPQYQGKLGKASLSRGSLRYKYKVVHQPHLECLLFFVLKSEFLRDLKLELLWLFTYKARLCIRSPLHKASKGK